MSIGQKAKANSRCAYLVSFVCFTLQQAFSLSPADDDDEETEREIGSRSFKEDPFLALTGATTNCISEKEKQVYLCYSCITLHRNYRSCKDVTRYSTDLLAPFFSQCPPFHASNHASQLITICLKAVFCLNCICSIITDPEHLPKSLQKRSIWTDPPICVCFELQYGSTLCKISSTSFLRHIYSFEPVYNLCDTVFILLPAT